MNENHPNLSDDSIRQIEAATAAHRAVVELSEARRQELEAIKEELKMTTMELDHLRLTSHDTQERLVRAEETARKSDAARVAYETLILSLAQLLTEFLPPQSPSFAHRAFRSAQNPSDHRVTPLRPAPVPEAS
jgi:hypothetical protein